jgi:hypothetical protein
MAETTPFAIGADASCTDGVCGEVSRVVVDPVARAVTHLVVEPKGRQGLGRLVPLDLVDAAEGEIRLRCTIAEFENLDAAEETQFVPGTRGYAAYGPEQVLSWPYSSLGGGAGVEGDMVAGVSETVTRPRGRGGGAPRRARPRHRRQDRTGRGARHRPSQPPCDPRASPGRALVGPQGSGHPDQRRDRGRRRYPAQHHQAPSAGLAACGHRSPERVERPAGGEKQRQRTEQPGRGAQRNALWLAHPPLAKQYPPICTLAAAQC